MAATYIKPKEPKIQIDNIVVSPILNSVDYFKFLAFWERYYINIKR